MAKNDSEEVVLLDTHAHYYPSCSFDDFFDAMFNNMRSAANDLGVSSFTAAACLLETAGTNWYSQLAGSASGLDPISGLNRWRVDTQTGRIRLYTADEWELYLIPGRQVVSQERLELLVLGCEDEVDFFKPAHYYLEQLCEDYLVIFPWGVGKWLGKRGRLVHDLLGLFPGNQFMLGDNSGRPGIWSLVPQFEVARIQGRRVLAGSDPLPAKGQYKKAGCYGCVLRGEAAFRWRSGDMKSLFCGENSPVETYGRLDGVLEFIVGQVSMRLAPIKLSG